LSTSDPARAPWPGQAALARTLIRLQREGRVPSALLVVGMRGLPSTPYADAVAEALICPAPVGGWACGVCSDCRLLGARSHPDLLAVRPEGSQVRIDAVREALAWAAYRPQTASVRVVRLEGADRMGGEAAVAALKGVEEPGPSVHWVLSADAPGRVPAPLRSRCVPLALRTVPAADIQRWLTAMGVEPERAAALAAEAGGFPEDALGALEAAAGRGSGGAAEEPAAMAQDLRRRLRLALRSGALGGGEARQVLALWSLAEQGLRRASPPRLVADVLRAADERVPKAAP
jgi:DNA polymerase III subunit delta'